MASRFLRRSCFLRRSRFLRRSYFLRRPCSLRRFHTAPVADIARSVASTLCAATEPERTSGRTWTVRRVPCPRRATQRHHAPSMFPSSSLVAVRSPMSPFPVGCGIGALRRQARHRRDTVGCHGKADDAPALHRAGREELPHPSQGKGLANTNGAAGTLETTGYRPSCRNERLGLRFAQGIRMRFAHHRSRLTPARAGSTPRQASGGNRCANGLGA
jgi:hypothetical protein